MVYVSEREDVLTLVDEEGNEHLFSVIDLLKLEEREYAILLPLEQEGESSGDEAIIFRVVEDEQGQALLAVEDEDEWEEVASAWEEKASEMEDDS